MTGSRYHSLSCAPPGCLLIPSLPDRNQISRSFSPPRNPCEYVLPSSSILPRCTPAAALIRVRLVNLIVTLEIGSLPKFLSLCSTYVSSFEVMVPFYESIPNSSSGDVRSCFISRSWSSAQIRVPLRDCKRCFAHGRVHKGCPPKPETHSFHPRRPTVVYILHTALPTSGRSALPLWVLSPRQPLSVT